MPVVSRMARIAEDATWAGADFRALRIQVIVHAAGGLLVLLVVTALSVFKPWDLTAYGRRQVLQTDLSLSTARAGVESTPAFPSGTPRWGRIVGIHAIALFLLFVVLHILGGGLGHHNH